MNIVTKEIIKELEDLQNQVLNISQDNFLKQENFRKIIDYFDFIKQYHQLKITAMNVAKSDPMFDIFEKYLISDFADFSYMIVPFRKFANLFWNQLPEELKNKGKENKFLILKNHEFFYIGNKLDLKIDSYGYIILKTIYDMLDGNSGEISYKDLIKKLSKNKKFNRMNNADIKEKIIKYGTSHTEGIGLKIKLKEKNGKPLICVNYGYGIVFNNN